MEVLLFGHRGAAGEAPENTMSGFAYAWEAGIRCFELDIHLSRDRQLVVIHDPVLERTTDGRGRVGNFSAAELRALNTCRFPPGWLTREGIPLLQDVLSIYRERIVHWQLEIKTDTPENLENIGSLLAQELRSQDLFQQVTVTSFDPTALITIGRLLPGLRRGLISDFGCIEQLKLPLELGCTNVCVPLRTSNQDVVQAATTAGLQVTGWLGNTIDEIKLLLAWGVNAITTDYPSLAVPYLRQRGLLTPGQVQPCTN